MMRNSLRTATLFVFGLGVGLLGIALSAEARQEFGDFEISGEIFNFSEMRLGRVGGDDLMLGFLNRHELLEFGGLHHFAFANAFGVRLEETHDLVRHVGIAVQHPLLGLSDDPPHERCNRADVCLQPRQPAVRTRVGRAQPMGQTSPHPVSIPGSEQLILVHGFLSAIGDFDLTVNCTNPDDTNERRIIVTSGS